MAEFSGQDGKQGVAYVGYLNDGLYEFLGGFWVGRPPCIVNLELPAAFAAHWLDGSCNENNNWCGGADMNHLGDVDLDD